MLHDDYVLLIRLAGVHARCPGILAHQAAGQEGKGTGPAPISTAQSRWPHQLTSVSSPKNLGCRDRSEVEVGHLA